MRIPTLPTLALAVALGLQGCASAGQSWRAGPAGIAAEQQLRARMSSGQYGSALADLDDKRIAPADALLRQMYRGLVAMHAGQNELGTRALDRAWTIAYQRYTKRLSDGAQSMVTGDGALPYDPGNAELLLVPYYGGLNWLARNESGEAAVEARRMSTVLASESNSLPDARFQGVMRYIAGVMFEVAGERNDADVAYRNANVLLNGDLPGDTIPLDAGHGDVIVLIEDGFVARPAPAGLSFWVNRDEAALLESDDDAVRMSTYREIDRRRGVSRDWAAESYRNVSMRWPVMSDVNPQAGQGVLGARATRLAAVDVLSDSAMLDAAATGRAVQLPVLGEGTGDPPIAARAVGMSVSDAVRADFDRGQPGRIARALGRVAVRELSLKGAEGAFNAAGDIIASDDEKEGKGEKGDKKDEDKKAGKAGAAVGAILLGIGLLAIHASSQILDQPDLRAWQLLPDRITVARMRLPVGEHIVEVTRDGQARSLGAVTVRPGQVTVLVHRWWPGAEPVVAAAPER
ncbi:MAG: hypothetical protein K8S21_13135 [Gemmatimonadetes bacterium]|nr:hypothetical protein [Gemmatimonadota bacterium]